MSYTLIVSEKPSVGLAISKVIGASSRSEGYLSGSEYIVSWCLGHLLASEKPDAYDERYKRWMLDDLPILPEKWLYTVPKDKQKQYKILTGLMLRPDVDTIICATDAGREGELIFRLVYEHSRCKKPVKRLWISSMEDSAIREGFANLKDGSEYDRLYDAALCREKANWLVGMNATRLFSIVFNHTLNVGRVMTPTLAMLAERGAAISSFQKTGFYTLEADCGMFTVKSGRMENRTTTESMRETLDGGTATVTAVENEDKSAAPPLLYDLTTLQRDANHLFGYTAQQTLDCAQALYEKKLCTYPRTDSRYLTEDMAAGIPALVETVAEMLSFASMPERIDVSRIIRNDKVSDHHALLPTEQAARADFSDMPTAERNILTLVAVRLLCAVGDAHRYTDTIATLDMGGIAFTAKGHIVTVPGWKAVEQAFRASAKTAPEDEQPEAGTLPPLEPGQLFQSVHVSLREGFTSPPKAYTEDVQYKGGKRKAPENTDATGSFVAA